MYFLSFIKLFANKGWRLNLKTNDVKQKEFPVRYFQYIKNKK